MLGSVDRARCTLFPPTLDELLSDHHPARFFVQVDEWVVGYIRVLDGFFGQSRTPNLPPVGVADGLALQLCDGREQLAQVRRGEPHASTGSVSNSVYDTVAVAPENNQDTGPVSRISAYLRSLRDVLWRDKKRAGAKHEE